MTDSWGHNELQHDLANHLAVSRDRFIWEDMQIGPAGSPRPDVYTLNKSYSKPKPLSYEIKVSNADLRRDLTKGKWQSYLKFSSGVIFAVPAGLMNKKDLPAGCGLIVRHDNKWRTAKAPTLHPVKLPEHAMLKLLIDGVQRERSVQAARYRELFWPTKKARGQLSEDVVSAVRDLHGFKSTHKYLVEKAEEDAKRIVTKAKESAERAHRDVYAELREIAKVAGIDVEIDGLGPLDLAYQLREIRRNLSKDAALKKALRSLGYAHSQLETVKSDFEKMLEVAE